MKQSNLILVSQFSVRIDFAYYIACTFAYRPYVYDFAIGLQLNDIATMVFL